MIHLDTYRKQNPFFLAPMAGVTDKAFRSFMREMGCGIMTSELISARALQDKNQKTRQLMEFSEEHRPYGIQIFGDDPLTIGEGAKQAEAFGADFIDLNLGCPVSKIVKKGAGSALLKDLKKLSTVLQVLKSSVQIPVSLKIRTGWDDQNRNADQVAHIAYEEGFAWMSIHGRTRSQAYAGKADWNYIKSVKSQSQIPIVGNGDLISGKKACEALQFSGCDAVMIGRGCLNDPWIFLEAMDQLKKQEAGKVLQKDFKQVLYKLQNHLENFYDDRMFLLQLKKFSAWFSSGFPHSTEFRKSLFMEKDKGAVLQKMEEFFSLVQNYEKPPVQYEPFLMQGHG